MGIFYGAIMTNKHEPTAETRAKVNALASVGTPQDQIALVIGISKNTLIKHYRKELDPKYCDVIINRWQTLTGKEAILESTGEAFNAMVA